MSNAHVFQFGDRPTITSRRGFVFTENRVTALLEVAVHFSEKLGLLFFRHETDQVTGKNKVHRGQRMIVSDIMVLKQYGFLDFLGKGLPVSTLGHERMIDLRNLAVSEHQIRSTGTDLRRAFAASPSQWL